MTSLLLKAVWSRATSAVERITGPSAEARRTLASWAKVCRSGPRPGTHTFRTGGRYYYWEASERISVDGTLRGTVYRTDADGRLALMDGSFILAKDGSVLAIAPSLSNHLKTNGALP